jgi:anti-anti-sigma factor
VVDLEGVTFMDSTGLGVLIELAGDADDDGATFAVENPSRSVQRLLEISGLAERFIR